VKNNQGVIDHYVALFNDISEEKKYELERKKKDDYLLQQSRMAQMGEMISMIAHQWRQPLGAISATSISLQTKMALNTFDLEDESGRKECLNYFDLNLKLVDDYVQNLSMTIDDFRNFYKPNKQSAKALICAPIAKALQIIRPLLVSKKIDIVENYECNKKVEMFENEMMQVVLNILKNAQDNFHEKKTPDPVITISTRSNESGSLIEICDNGGGLREEVLLKAFDPYFSTKDEKNGTGLGLYMSKTIIEAHHKGQLTVENRGGGACFIIEISNQIKADT
jgi:signal transduction histidine kinase